MWNRSSHGYAYRCTHSTFSSSIEPHSSSVVKIIDAAVVAPVASSSSIGTPGSSTQASGVGKEFSTLHDAASPTRAVPTALFAFVGDSAPATTLLPYAVATTAVATVPLTPTASMGGFGAAAGTSCCGAGDDAGGARDGAFVGPGVLRACVGDRATRESSGRRIRVTVRREGGAGVVAFGVLGAPVVL